MNKDSANEVCFKVDGVVCVILLNKEKPGDELVNLFSNIQNWLSPKIDRGIKYKFGWLNTSTQNKFMSTVDLPFSSGPTLLLANPGKRKRFFVLENDLNEENISKYYLILIFYFIIFLENVFDRLASGDIRFKNFKGNSIPDLE